MLVVGAIAAGIVGGLVLAMPPRAVDALGVRTPAPSGSAEAIEKTVPVPGHEVYGFVPYWEMDDGIAAHLRATRTTTVALFSITHTKQGKIATNQNGYRRIDGPIGRQIIADAHELGRRVDVT